MGCAWAELLEPGRRVAHVADALGADQPLHVLLLKHVPHQAVALAQMQLWRRRW